MWEKVLLWQETSQMFPLLLLLQPSSMDASSRSSKSEMRMYVPFQLPSILLRVKSKVRRNLSLSNMSAACKTVSHWLPPRCYAGFLPGPRDVVQAPTLRLFSSCFSLQPQMLFPQVSTQLNSLTLFKSLFFGEASPTVQLK